MSTFIHHDKPDLTEEDIKNAVAAVQSLPVASSEMRKNNGDQAFREFASQVVGLVDAGTITPMRASYCIAGYYLNIATEDETVIAIGDLACELESPESVVGRPVAPEWERLRNLIAS